MSEPTLHFWRDGGDWHCAEPRPDPLAAVRDEGADWWKRFLPLGIGKTPAEALEDWRSWQRSVALFNDIY